ncbi:proteasome subunit beta type [Cyclospora cayetanensis]|uniref:Proteasome subunit beta n=1 Tax=Cyclospora cayetanensis TaxID=88456 RepID=A0A1D3CZC5_9EIME|nr:proteasome subunit beta type [Cyclospora cayetanensis]
MAYVADLSIWDTPNPMDAVDEEVQDTSCFDLAPGKFVLAPVQHPAAFASRLFECNKRLPSPFSLHMNPPSASSGGSTSMAVKKGTTTLGFAYQGGIVIAVDSRASMGTFISSQTVCKVLEISDVILGTMAGGAADCSYWERYLSKLCRLFELRNQVCWNIEKDSSFTSCLEPPRRYKSPLSPPPVCCHSKLALSTMIAGWNATKDEPELYFVDDKATRLKGNLFSCGSGSTFAYGVLDNTYRWQVPF